MTVTHEEDISINIRFDAPPAQRRGFGTVLHIAPMADASLDGDRVRTYKDLEAVKSDQQSGYLSQDQVDAATFAFNQEPRPDELMIGNVDLGGSETHDTALQNIIDADASFYGVTASSRTDSELATLASAVESHEMPMLCGIQSSLSDLLGAPSDPILNSTPFSNVVGNERTILVYHDRSGAYSAVALLAQRLGFSPDDTSAQWHCHLYDAGSNQAPMQYQTKFKGSERDNLFNNHANGIAAFGVSDHYLKPGQTMAGRDAYVQVSADWLKTRLETDVAVEIDNASRDGQKIEIGRVGEQRTPGQVQMAKLVRDRLQQGEENDHFIEGSSSLNYPEIEQSNVDDNTIPLDASTLLEIDGSKLNLSLEFNRGSS